MTGSDPPATGTTTRRLLQRAKAGSRAAVSALVARELPHLRRWATGRLPAWARRGIDTADLIQEALVRTVRNLPHFEPRGHRALQAYLRQSVANAIKTELARAIRHPPPAALAPDHPSVAPSPLESTLGRETAGRYLMALSRLSEGDRLAVVARVEQQRSYDQIALILGKSNDAARMQVNRALERLAREMASG